MTEMKKVSFVIPCYRSEHTLPHVVAEIENKMQQLTQYTYDIYLVNDCSPDGTLAVIRRLCAEHENINRLCPEFRTACGTDGGTSPFGRRLCGMSG